MVWRGRQGRCGLEGRVKARFGVAGGVSCGRERLGGLWLGKAGLAGEGWVSPV
jgi:hypothetical protein